MQNIETAWKSFFKQFCNNVFVDGEYIDDPNMILFPRITFSYGIVDYFEKSLTTFQVWTMSHNNAQLWEICNKISDEIQAESGSNIFITNGNYYEYKNPKTGAWIKFEIEDFQEIANSFAPLPVEWREVQGEEVGGINIKRGNPFLTPSPKDENMIRAMYGTLDCFYYTL